MELHQLRYFVAVAETGSFTRAAERCYVTQPSLSQQILNLEDELGRKLFHRLGRKAVLTDSGGLFIARARRALAEVEAASRELKDPRAASQRIQAGAIPTIMPFLLLPLIARARANHPGLLIETREDFRTPLAKAVLEGELDLAIVAAPVRDTRVSIEPLFTEELMLVLSKDHRLARRRPVIPADLTDETFVMLGYSSSLSAQIQQFCGANNFEPRIGYRCMQLETLREFVSLGLGISILPQIARAAMAQDPSLVCRRLSGHAPRREILLVRNQQREQSGAVTLFLDMLRETLRKISGLELTKTPAPK